MWLKFEYRRYVLRDDYYPFRTHEKLLTGTVFVMLGANLFGLLFCTITIGKIRHRYSFAGVALHFESYIVHQSRF